AVTAADEAARQARDTMERDQRNMWRDQLDLARAQDGLGDALARNIEAGQAWNRAFRAYHDARLSHYARTSETADSLREEARERRNEAQQRLNDLRRERDRIRELIQELRDNRPDPEDAAAVRRYDEQRAHVEERTQTLPREGEQAERDLQRARAEFGDRTREAKHARDDLALVREEHGKARTHAEQEGDRYREDSARIDELDGADERAEELQRQVDAAERDSGKSREDDLGTYSRQLDHLLGNELLERNRVRLNVPGSGGRHALDNLLDRFRPGLPAGLANFDAFADRFRSDFAANPYPFYGDRGHTVRIGDDSVTLKLRSANNDWRRSGDPHVRPDDSVPDLSNTDTATREVSHTDTRSAGARRTVGGGIYINPMPAGPAMVVGPAIAPSAAFSLNQPSTNQTVAQQASTQTETSVGGKAVDYATELVAELTVDSDRTTGDDEGVALHGTQTVREPGGLSMTVELGDRASDAPARIRLHDPFAPGERPDGAQDIGTRAPGGHTAKVNGIYHAQDGAPDDADGPRTTMADWVADYLNQPQRRSLWDSIKDRLPNFMRRHRPDPRRADQVREQLSEESVRDMLRDASRGPEYLSFVDNTGRTRLAKMWSVPTDFTRIPDAPAKLDLKDKTSSAKSTDSRFLRGDSFNPGIGVGAVVQIVGNLFRLEMPMVEYRHERSRGLGNARQSGGTTSVAAETGDTAMYDVRRNVYLQFDGEATPHRFTGTTVDVLGVDDAQLLADPHRNDADARERADHVPAYPHLRRDRPDHLGGTTVRGITWRSGHRYTRWDPAGQPADGTDGTAAPPHRTVFDAYAQQVLEGIARKYPGLVVPEMARTKDDFAHRPDGEHDDAFFSRENHFRRSHPIAVYNTLRVLRAASERNLSDPARADTWLNEGIDVHLIETADINPDLSNFNPWDPDKEGWFLPDVVTVRLKATPRGREFGGTVTKNHTSGSAEGTSGRGRVEEHGRSHTGGVRVRGVYRDIPSQDPRGMPGVQGGIGVRGHVTHQSTRGLETGGADKVTSEFKDEGDTDIWRYDLDLHAEMGKFRKTDDLPPGTPPIRTRYDGHRVDLLTTANGQPVAIHARMELETPAQLDPHARETEASGRPEPDEADSTRLTSDRAKNMINGGRPDTPVRTPQAAGLDTIPTYTQKISTTVGDVDLRQRIYGVLDGAPGLQRFLKERAGHDFYPAHYSADQLASHSDRLLAAPPGYRSRNWMRDFFFSGRHTTALFADRTDATFHDPRPNSALKISSQHDTNISRSRGSSWTAGVETEVRGAGNPNPSAESLRAGQDANDPGRGKLRADQANAPTTQAIWNPFSGSRTLTGTSVSESATYSQKTSFQPQGGSTPYTADLSITGAAEIRNDWDFGINVPRRDGDDDFRAERFDAPQAEFGYAPSHSLYRSGLVNDRYVPPGDGETAGRTEPQPNPNLDTRRFRVRPGFEEVGQHLGSLPRPAPDTDGRGAVDHRPTGTQLDARLRRDNYTLTGESREAVLDEISAHTTGRGVPKTLDVKLVALGRRASRGPEGTDRRVEVGNQIRHGTIKIETVRGRPTVTDLGGKATFGSQTSLATSDTRSTPGTTTRSTRFEVAEIVPTRFSGSDEPRNLPSELPRDRPTNVAPAPNVSASSTTNRTDSDTEKTTITWTTEVEGPYAIAETPEHIRLTVSYGDRSFTIEGDYATVRESFPAAYLELVDAAGGVGGSTPARRSGPAPAPRLVNPTGRLNGSVQDWRDRAPRPDGGARRPDVPIAPLTVQDHGANVLDAAYVAIARAHGWQHTGALDAAAIPRSSATSHSSAVTESTTAGGGLPTRPAGTTAEDPPADTPTAPTRSTGLAGGADLVSTGERGGARTDGHTDNDRPVPGPDATSKRSYLVSIPVDWVVSAEVPHRSIPGFGRRPTRGMAAAETTVTGWVGEDDARALGLLDQTRGKAWDRVADTQEKLGDAEKTYYDERAKLPPLVRRLIADPTDQPPGPAVPPPPRTRRTVRGTAPVPAPPSGRPRPAAGASPPRARPPGGGAAATSPS
ncbi:hypothetical protein, partial [Marinitenerispora sediminis]|uniref:hypothetical protein n=1 Tax=Marinitenerispora sediminis TaxID=1931232 RepID=UPI000DFB41B5